MKRWLPPLLLSLLLLGLTACGGGGGSAGEETAALPPLGPGETAYDDPTAYSSAAGAALNGAVEGAAVTRHSLTLGSTRIAYTAHAGHLIARHPVSGAAQASVFYVAYLAEGANAATRPVTFFYNGGPGSASVWLHLGSFGPKRLATGVPATTAATPFALVDNSESLLDTSDLVFIDAVGTGLSQAITPFSNSSFWGVDADAALFRDAIQRWQVLHGRSASPLFLFGESYGGPRTAVLARRLQEAGVPLQGLVLQSPALDYNSNCGVIGAGGCSGYLPTYAAVGAWHQLTNPVPTDLGAYMTELRGFTAAQYLPALQAGPPLRADLPPLLAARTGFTAANWARTDLFNLQPGSFQNLLFANSIIGRYDGRMVATRGTPLASEGDPSSTFIGASFSSGMANHLRNTLRYSNRSTYVLLGNAINTWDFSHAGRTLPDTVPDLAAALAADPGLQILAANGYHDLATPFYITELDLARLGVEPRVQVRNYAGGHMSYLDDGTRVLQKADLVAFYAQALASARVQPQRVTPVVRLAPPTVDRTGVVPTTPQPALAEPALQTPLRDPWVPPSASAAHIVRQRTDPP